MSNRNLLILTCITLVMIILAVITSNLTAPKETATGPSILLQGLNPDDISTIEIIAQNQTTTLKRKEGLFYISEKHGYPALSSQINKLLTDCMDIQTIELVTDSASNHPDLGADENSADTIIKFSKPNNEFITGIVIGKNKENSPGKYIRLFSDNKVYLSANVPWIRKNSLDYLEKKLFALDSDKIKQVDVKSKDSSYTIIADANNNPILQNVPQNKKQDNPACNKVFTALTSLHLDDVKSKTAASDLKFDSSYLCTLRDSTVYTIDIAENLGKTFIKCSAEYTDKTPIQKEREVESEEQLKQKEAKLIARGAAEEFSKKHSQWIYEVVQHKAENLTKKLDDLLQDAEPPLLPSD